MKIDFLKIRQVETTMQAAADSGLFATLSSEWARNDWERRLPRDAADTLRVYYYGDDVIGWVQTEVADFNTLTDWLAEYAERRFSDKIARRVKRENARAAKAAAPFTPYPRCPDCNEPGEHKGHQTCAYPS